MGHSGRTKGTILVVFLLVTAMATFGRAQQAPMYRTDLNWLKLPEGRKSLGAVANIRLDPKGQHIWILSRCGSTHGCASTGVDVDPVLKVALDGKVVKTFGKGLLNFPHGLFVDRDGFVYVTDGAPMADDRSKPGLKRGIGFQVFKFNPEGQVVMTLGTKGVGGSDERHFDGVSGIAVDAQGDLWIVDGHRYGNNRLMRFSKDGTFIRQWGGGVGAENGNPGLFNDPHDINIDPNGRIYVADRGNNRVQVFDKDGNYIKQWTQFGKASSVFFDTFGNVLVPDGMSIADGIDRLINNAVQKKDVAALERRDQWNEGWEKGIRIGNAATGWVTAFLPDVDGSTTESVAVDLQGNVYAGQPQAQRVVRYVPSRPGAPTLPRGGNSSSR